MKITVLMSEHNENIEANLYDLYGTLLRKYPGLKFHVYLASDWAKEQISNGSKTDE